MRVAPHALRLLLCAALSLMAGGRAVAQGEGIDVTREQLEAHIQNVSGSTELDEQSIQTLVALYRRSLANLEAHERQSAAVEEVTGLIASASVDAEALRDELARESGRALPDDPGPIPGDVQALTRALLTARADILGVESDIAQLQQQLSALQQLLEELRHELQTANEQQVAGLQVQEPAVQAVESAELKRARRWFRETAALTLGSRIRLLEQQLIGYTPLRELRQLQLQLQQLEARRLAARVAGLEAALIQRRQLEATQALALARSAAEEAEGRHPLLGRVARENVRLGESLQGRSLDLQETTVATEAATRQARELEEKLRTVRSTLETAGLNKALGRLLQGQRSALPREGVLRYAIAESEDRVADLELERILEQDQISALGDLDTYVPALAAGSGEAAAGEMKLELDRRQLKALLRQQRGLLRQSSALIADALQAQKDLLLAQERLARIARRYDRFLREHLLWVRSVSVRSLGAVSSFSGEALRYLSPEALWQTARDLVSVTWFTPLMVLAGLLSSALLLLRPRLLRGLQNTSRYVGNPVRDRFRSTLQALLITALLCVPGPLLLVAIAWKLATVPQPSGLTDGLATGLLFLGRNWFFFTMFYQVCRAEGLAHRHFRWHEPALQPLRREVAWLKATFLPLAFASATLFGMDTAAVEWPVLSFFLVLSMLVFAGFYWRILRRDGGLMRALADTKGYVSLVRLRWVWLLLTVCIPVCLVALTALGYVYSALILTASFIMSFWVLIAMVLVHQLCVRWLRLSATRLGFAHLQEERARQLEDIAQFNAGVSEAPEVYQVPEVDVRELGRVSLKLVNAITAVVATVGFFLVWSQVLPALNYFDNIVVWAFASQEAGQAVIRTVTLASVGGALLVLVVGGFVYRTLPPMLELLLLELTGLSYSQRDTLITLARYLLVAMLLSLVASLLGFEWARFQWLATAMGVGIGFGLKEILANFMSGLIILLEQPIRVGDRVTVGDVEGRVTRVRMRATTIQTWDRQELVVPNKSFISGSLLNWSLSDPISRLVVDVGVAYGSDVTRAMARIAEVAVADPKVLTQPPPLVTLEGFGDNTLVLRLRCYLDDLEARLTTRSRLNEGINRAFAREGIAIAFPQRDVHLDLHRTLPLRLVGA